MRFRLVMVPGTFGECVERMARPFEDSVLRMAKFGWIVVLLNVSDRSRSAASVERIRALPKATPGLAGKKAKSIAMERFASSFAALASYIQAGKNDDKSNDAFDALSTELKLYENQKAAHRPAVRQDYCRARCGQLALSGR